MSDIIQWAGMEMEIVAGRKTPSYRSGNVISTWTTETDPAEPKKRWCDTHKVRQSRLSSRGGFIENREKKTSKSRYVLSPPVYPRQCNRQEMQYKEATNHVAHLTLQIG